MNFVFKASYIKKILCYLVIFVAAAFFIDFAAKNIFPEISAGAVLPAAVLGALAVVALIKKFIGLSAIYNTYKTLCSERKLIWSLAKNDFKRKYAGSYFGIIWAFVQPVCTIMLFWFVFQVGLRSTAVGNAPFLLWLMCGLVPWFFFSEAWNTASFSLIEYSFLVKKVVFQINILPAVKIVSALFVHIFFVAFMLLVFMLYGYRPDIYWFQCIYYSLCLVILILSISYMCSAVMVFFKDLSQIMNIALQFGMWLTPIMWNIDIIPSGLRWIFKLNPMYYIVQGYRDSLIGGIPFYYNMKQTAYFWLVAGLLMLGGFYIFGRLKPHFADVL